MSDASRDEKELSAHLSIVGPAVVKSITQVKLTGIVTNTSSADAALDTYTPSVPGVELRISNSSGTEIGPLPCALPPSDADWYVEMLKPHDNRVFNFSLEGIFEPSNFPPGRYSIRMVYPKSNVVNITIRGEDRVKRSQVRARNGGRSNSFDGALQI